MKFKIVIFAVVLCLLSYPAFALKFKVNGAQGSSFQSLSKWDNPGSSSSSGSSGSSSGGGGLDINCYSIDDTNLRSYCRRGGCSNFSDNVARRLCEKSKAAFSDTYTDIPSYINRMGLGYSCSSSGLSGDRLSACQSCERMFGSDYTKKEWLLYSYKGYYWNCILKMFTR